MNQPGSTGGWSWRLSEIPSPDLARRLREATEEAGRAAENLVQSRPVIVSVKAPVTRS